MMGRVTFGVLCLAAASAALGQNVQQASVETRGPRLLAKAESSKILAAIPAVDADMESETDCSHLVHEIYEQAGFPYDYVTSRELYIGSANFTRVRAPQAGDLVVWRGHVGIVTDPKQRSFFSFVRSGPDTQFYDSPYWRARGTARFFRYVVEKPFDAGPRLQGVNQVGEQSSPTVEIPRETVLQVAGKNPSPDEVAAGFVAMNQDSGEFLRTRNLSSPRKSIVVYRELRVSAVQIKGKRGTALVQIESLDVPSDRQKSSQLRWKEQSLELEKTKRGWVMTPIQYAAYVKREVALQILSARLADLAQNPDVTPEQEREQRQIIRFLNALVIENSVTASAEKN